MRLWGKFHSVAIKRVKFMHTKEYVVVTAVTSYRMRYVMHRDDLQKLNPNDPVNTVEWANDTVTMEECEEFSQEHMGEYIVHTAELDEAEMLVLFDKDNEYLRDWPASKVIAMVRSLLANKENTNDNSVDNVPSTEYIP
jgi:hypothetical protein